MFKKQKSKILVFLLMLGLLYGCKRQILDPLNPQNNLPQKANFDKVKGFYENGRYKNQPKRTSGNGNERMSAQDSARFKDFEPQWDKTEVELFPNNEKMLIVPVVRFLNVDYNKNIGFIRRLCIRVDANDDFLEANIVELIGNLTFVKANYNAIFKNYKENSVVSGFDGGIIVYEIDYDVATSKKYTAGSFDGGVLTVAHACVNCVSYPIIQIWWYFSSGLGYGGWGNPNDPDNDPPVYTGQSGGGGSGSGGSGNNNTPRPSGSPRPQTVNIPIPPMPFPGMVLGDDLVWYFPDGGVSWGNENEGMFDDDGNVIQQLTPDDSLKLVRFKQIFASNGSHQEKDLKFARKLDSMRNASPIADSIYKKVYASLRSNRGLSFTPKVYLTHLRGPVNGAIWGENFGNVILDPRGIPIMQLGEKADIEVFMEELTHVLQYLERYSNVTPDNTELVHLEMEAKIINHLMFGVRGGTALFSERTNGLYIYEDEYKKWLAIIQQENLGSFGNGKFNQINWNIHIRNFASFPDPAYNNLQNVNFNPTRTPTIIFLLFNP